MTDELVRPTRRRLLTVALVATVAVESFVVTAVTTLMPRIAAETGAQDVYAAVFALFNVALLIGLILGGRLSDTVGWVRVLVLGSVVHQIGMVLAGVALDVPLLILGRILQGGGTGAVTVAIYVLIAEVYDARHRGRVFALMATAWAAPGLLGPLLGGLLADAVGWRAIFLGSPILELAILGLVARQLRVIDRGRHANSGAGGLFSALLPAVALGLGVAAVSTATALPGRTPWPALLVGLVVTAVATYLLLPSGTLSLRTGLPAGLFLRGLTGGLLGGTQILIPLALIDGRAYSATAAGAAISCGVVGFSVGGMLEGRGVWRRPIEVRVRTWSAVLALGLGATAVGLHPGAPAALLFAGWTVAGVGFGTLATALNVFVLESAAPTERGTISGAARIAEQVATSILISLGGVAVTTLATPGPDRASTSAAVVGVLAAFALAASLTAHRLRSPVRTT